MNPTNFTPAPFFVSGWRDGLMLFESDIFAETPAAAAALALHRIRAENEAGLGERDLIEVVDLQSEAHWFEVRSPDFFRYYVAAIPTPEDA